jgi:hypothetical protein
VSHSVKKKKKCLEIVKKYSKKLSKSCQKVVQKVVKKLQKVVGEIVVPRPSASASLKGPKAKSLHYELFRGENSCILLRALVIPFEGEKKFSRADGLWPQNRS